MSLSRCSQLTVSGFRFSRSRSLGGGKVGHSWMMWWAVCCSAPHGQAADGRRPQRCILALNRPTPVRSRFSVAQSLRGRSAPGGKLVFGVTESWGGGGGGRGVCCQLVLHDWSVLNRSHQWMLSGGRTWRREGRRWRPRSWESDTSLCRRWFGSCEALLTSLYDFLCSFPCVGQLVQCQIIPGETPLEWVSGSRWQSSWSRWGWCRVSWHVHCGSTQERRIQQRYTPGRGRRFSRWRDLLPMTSLLVGV